MLITRHDPKWKKFQIKIKLRKRMYVLINLLEKEVFVEKQFGWTWFFWGVSWGVEVKRNGQGYL